MEQEIIQALDLVRKASRQMVKLTDQDIQDILNELADLTLENEAYILEENQKDLDRMDPSNPKYDRLLIYLQHVFPVSSLMSSFEEGVSLVTLLLLVPLPVEVLSPEF